MKDLCEARLEVYAAPTLDGTSLAKVPMQPHKEGAAGPAYSLHMQLGQSLLRNSCVDLVCQPLGRRDIEIYRVKLAAYPMVSYTEMHPSALHTTVPVSAKSAPRTVTLTDADANKEISLHTGDTLVIQLHDPGDGGYSWNYLWDEQDTLLKPLPFQHIEPPPPPKKGPRIAGNFGTDVYRFVVNSGTEGQGTYVRFLSLRPFEKSVATDSLWQVRVDVE